MNEEDHMKVVAADQDDPSLILAFTFPAAATIAYVADKVRDYVGVGNPYYAFATIPAAVETNIAADFTDAPIVSISVAENEAAINGMLQDSALQALLPAVSRSPDRRPG
jgi:hypothetical protein